MSRMCFVKLTEFLRDRKLGPPLRGLGTSPPSSAYSIATLQAILLTIIPGHRGMESFILRSGCRRAIAPIHNPTKRRALRQPCRFYATPSEPSGPIRAAGPITFTPDADQFARPRTQGNFNRSNSDGDSDALLQRVRVVPASPSYFTATPRYTDDLLYLASLARKYQLIPQEVPGQELRVAWKSWQDYCTETGEPVRMKAHGILVGVLKRLNSIHHSLMPIEVQRTLQRFKRRVQPHLNQAKPIPVDTFGRARAVGRRKSSSAVVFLVEGDGECRVNGRTLTDYFGRLQDRESAVWPLKATERLDKYNVFAVAKGGGTTGQAEAITLGVAKALLAHEPDLKPMLRRGKCYDVQRTGAVVMLTFCNSWCCHARSQEGREEEARPSQGEKKACLGQAIVLVSLSIHRPYANSLPNVAILAFLRRWLHAQILANAP